MRKIYQQWGGKNAPPGSEDCMRASVATLLGLTYDEVPHFPQFDMAGTYDPFATWEVFYNFFRERGLHVLQLSPRVKPDCVYLGVGAWSEGSNLDHMVVMRKGAVIHNPGGSLPGLTYVKHIFLVLPIDMSNVFSDGWVVV